MWYAVFGRGHPGFQEADFEKAYEGDAGNEESFFWRKLEEFSDLTQWTLSGDMFVIFKYILILYM